MDYFGNFVFITRFFPFLQEKSNKFLLCSLSIIKKINWRSNNPKVEERKLGKKSKWTKDQSDKIHEKQKDVTMTKTSK